MVYNLDDLYIGKLRENGHFEPVKIEESAYYQCLACERYHDKSLKIFSDYLDLLTKYGRRGASYEEFFSTFRSIRDNGYDYELEPKIRLHGSEHRHCRNGREYVRDGQHRLAILKHLGFSYLQEFLPGSGLLQTTARGFTSDVICRCSRQENGERHALDDIRVEKWIGNGHIIPVKIEESAYYQCLVHRKDPEKSSKIFSDYVRKHHPNSSLMLSYDQFLSLFRDIRDNGFNYGLHPQIMLHLGRNIRVGGFSSARLTAPNALVGLKLVRDGQHRLAILKYLGFKEISL